MRAAAPEHVHAPLTCAKLRVAGTQPIGEALCAPLKASIVPCASHILLLLHFFFGARHSAYFTSGDLISSRTDTSQTRSHAQSFPCQAAQPACYSLFPHICCYSLPRTAINRPCSCLHPSACD